MNNIFINEIWDKFLNIELLQGQVWFDRIKEFIPYIYRKSDKVSPIRENLFKMYNLLRPEEINVVLVFQDPYPQIKDGIRLAQGIGLGTYKMTASLRHFFQAIDKDVDLEKVDTTFLNLIKQGIFSTNKYLMVNGEPLSLNEFKANLYKKPVHLEYITQLTLSKLNNNYKNLVYIFFGRESHSLANDVDNKNNLIIKTSHPSPTGFKHGILESDFANKTNEYLKKHNKKEIIWV